MGYMDSIDTAEAKLLFDAGSLKSATAVPEPMGRSGHWLLQFEAQNRSQVHTLAAQREPQRVFKSADAVLATAHKIGFRVVKFQI